MCLLKKNTKMSLNIYQNVGLCWTTGISSRSPNIKAMDLRTIIQQNEVLC